jgi:hypothetical protein
MSETKEEFCGACIAVPFALAGAGVTAYGAGGSKKGYKKQKKIAFWVGIGVTLLSLAIAVYYLWIKKDCSDCE